MTIINPNSISGIVSITSESNALHFYESDGDKLNINADLTGNVTGNVTGTTATFSGDVTVGGVLSYEDVTNIDSVGVITARNGVYFGPASAGKLVIGTSTGIGIGSDSPTEALDVPGTVVTGGIKLVNNQRNDLSRKIVIASSSIYHLRMYDPNDLNVMQHIFRQDGRVAINTSTTATGSGANLVVGGRIQSNDGGYWFGGPTGAEDGWHVQQSSDDLVIVESGVAERVRVSAGGSFSVGNSNPVTDLDVSTKTGAVALPQGTTAQRPTGSAPYIRKNTTNNALEYYDGTSWVEIITDYFPTGSVILG
jgi:hypothetical protein